MPRLFEYVLEVRKQSPAEFAATYPYPFLLQYRDAGENRDGWTFKTQTISMASAKLASLAASEQLEVSPELAKFDVYPIEKALNNPWQERISIGRARNNDIVLGDSSVSKLHAHFKRTKTGDYFVADAGSRNGTRLNDQPLEPNTAAPVKLGDTLTFGRATVTFVDAFRLHDLVSKHVKSAGPRP